LFSEHALENLADKPGASTVRSIKLNIKLPGTSFGIASGLRAGRLRNKGKGKVVSVLN
jgi:hypothetical protein